MNRNLPPPIPSPLPAAEQSAADLLAPIDHPLARPDSRPLDPNNTVEATPLAPQGVKCIAVRDGFYRNNRLGPKDGEFVVESFDKVGDWMKCVDPVLERKHQQKMKERKAIIAAQVAEMQSRGK